MSFPLPNANSRNFLLGTVGTALAAATPPALQSLALSFCKPENSGKVLASMSALATISLSTAGPSLFAAVFLWAVDRKAEELVFVCAAAWISCSLFPLLLIKLRRRRENEEDGEEDAAL
jgi:hypothetical protein